MTTIFRDRKKCAVCGHEHDYTAVGSTNTFGGYPDLDRRPPEMARSTISYWVQECPECGYVSSDISRPSPVSREFLQSEEYRTCGGKTFESNLAKRFYRQYLIRREQGDTENSFYAILHCAWACDDYEDEENAKQCRETAVPLLEEMIHADHEDKLIFRIILPDLLRRSGQFERVIREYENAEPEGRDLKKIFRFHVERAKKKDAGCYTTWNIRIQKDTDSGQ